MDPVQILAVLNAAINVAPKLMDLYQKATSGTKVSATDVQAALSQYGVDRAVLEVSIARAQEDGR